MTNELDLFKRVHNKVQAAREEFTPIKERWYSWNYWAQHRQKTFSYGEWMKQNNVFEPNTKTHYPKADARYDREEGYNYYQAWRGARAALDDIENKYDGIFRSLWEAKTPEGEPYYTNDQLGKPLGMTGEQLRKLATKRSWHTPRNNKKGA